MVYGPEGKVRKPAEHRGPLGQRGRHMTLVPSVLRGTLAHQGLFR